MTALSTVINVSLLPDGLRNVRDSVWLAAARFENEARTVGSEGENEDIDEFV
jgi:hypothetical protein